MADLRIMPKNVYKIRVAVNLDSGEMTMYPPPSDRNQLAHFQLAQQRLASLIESRDD